MPIKINIKISGGETFEVEVESAFTVLELKEKCVDKAGVTPDKQRLIFKGRIVKDTDTLDSLKVEDGNTIHLVRSGYKPATGTPAPTTSNNPQQTVSPISPVSQPADNATPNTTPTSAGSLGFGQMPGFSPELMQQMMQGGLGGMGGFGGMAGMDNFNPEAAAALLNNPMVQEMMQQIASNPQLLRDIVGNNPLLQPMMQQNPVFNQMMNNPDLLRSVMNPGVLQSSLQLQQSMQQQQNPAGTPAGNRGANNMMNPLMGGGLPGYNFPGAGMPADTRPPEERYAFQLQTLQEMGFTNQEENLSVLNSTSGDISAAITRLLEARGNPSN